MCGNVEMPCRSCLKVIVVGNTLSGKSSVIACMMNKPSRNEVTIGCELHTMEVMSPSGCETSLLIWDLPGSERFKILTVTYARSAAIVMIVVDATNGVAEIDAQYSDWKELLVSTSPTYRYMIINKIDQLDDDAMQLLRDRFPCAYFTSSVTCAGLDEVCKDLQSRSMQLHRCNVAICHGEKKNTCF